MFFDTSVIDQKWQDIKKLYNQKKLTGIQNISVSNYHFSIQFKIEQNQCFIRSLKVSTMRENFKKSDNLFHVIVFRCGVSKMLILLI